MSILDRLFGKTTPPPEESAVFVKAAQEARATLDALQRKLALDPCAADPTREECGPELRRELHQLPDLASTLLTSRDAWRSGR
jgi:hypothetical protein